MFDVYTTGDTAHIDTIFKFLPHKRQHVDACVARTWISYRCAPCHPRCTHRTSLVVKKKLFQFSCGCEQFHYGRSFGFLVINVCNHGEHYETPCIRVYLTHLSTEEREVSSTTMQQLTSSALRRAVHVNADIIAQQRSYERVCWFCTWVPRSAAHSAEPGGSLQFSQEPQLGLILTHKNPVSTST